MAITGPRSWLTIFSGGYRFAIESDDAPSPPLTSTMTLPAGSDSHLKPGEGKGGRQYLVRTNISKAEQMNSSRQNAVDIPKNKERMKNR